MNKLTNITGVLIYFFMSQTLLAETPYTKNFMIVSPKQCVVSSKGSQCNKAVVFRFHLPESGYYCVYRDEEKIPLFCFSDPEFKSIQHLTLVKTTRFKLVDNTKTRLLIIKEIELLSYTPANPRKRRKHAWGIL